MPRIGDRSHEYEWLEVAPELVSSYPERLGHAQQLWYDDSLGRLRLNVAVKRTNVVWNGERWVKDEG